MPSTVYKGDLTEISFGHETGLRLEHNYAGSFKFSAKVGTRDLVADTSIIILDGGAAGTPVNANVLEYPTGMLVGATVTFEIASSSPNFSTDDSVSISGRTFKIVKHVMVHTEGTYSTELTISPALTTDHSLAVKDSKTNDVMTIHTFGVPTIDTNMAYNDAATSSSESVLTDQFVGLAATVTLPETKVDLKRYHVVGLGRDVAIQVPGRFINQGGSFEVNMHNTRWLYYCLGMEAIDYDAYSVNYTAAVAQDDYQLNGRHDAGAVTIKFEENSGSNNPTFASGAAVAVGDYVVIKDNTLADVVTYKEADATSFTDATCDYNNDPTINMDSTALLKVGMRVSGTGIPALATVASITNTTTFELSVSTTGGSVTNGTLTFTSVFGSLSEPEAIYFDQTETTEIRRIAAYTVNSGVGTIWLDDPLCFSHADHAEVEFVKFSTDTSQDKGPERASTGAITNPVKRLIYSRSHVPSFAMEVSVRRRDVDGVDADVVDGGATDPKQLTRVFRGCKVKDFSLTTDTDAALRLSVNFDSALCYTDTGRLEGTTFTDATCDYNNDPTINMDSTALLREGMSVSGTGIPAGATVSSITNATAFELSASTTGGSVTNGTLTFTSNPGDRYNPHRMFEDTANTDTARKESGIAVGTQKPFMFYNGSVTLAGVNVAQVVSFTLSGSTGVQQYYTINGSPVVDAETDQVPHAGSRNASLAVEGKTEYSLDMEIIVDDPIFYHKMRRAVDFDATTDNMIRLSFTKAGSGSNRESIDILLDDYVITEAPLPIPEDKGPMRASLKVAPKAMRVIATDTLLHS